MEVRELGNRARASLSKGEGARDQGDTQKKEGNRQKEASQS